MTYVYYANGSYFQKIKVKVIFPFKIETLVLVIYLRIQGTLEFDLKQNFTYILFLHDK